MESIAATPFVLAKLFGANVEYPFRYGSLEVQAQFANQIGLLLNLLTLIVFIILFILNFQKEGMTVLDGQVVEIGGLKFGFVGGGLKTPYRTPYEITDEEFQKNVDALGPVDVLCSHIPPF